MARPRLVYLAVAGFCLLLHNVILVAADSLGITLVVAVLASFVVVACAGYLLHAGLTFRQPFALSGLIRYGAAMTANIPLAFVTTWFWHQFAGLAMILAAPIASACMLVLNYALGKWAIGSPRARKVETL